jgi:hypothetical protein
MVVKCLYGVLGTLCNSSYVYAVPLEQERCLENLLLINVFCVLLNLLEQSWKN